MLACMQWIERRFSLLLVVAMLVGLFAPALCADWYPAVMPVLAGMLFFGGLRLDMAALRSHLKRPWRVAWDVSLQMLILPAVVFALVWLIDPRYALGAVAVAAAPAATSSPAVTALFRGCVASAVLLLVGTSLLAPLTLPLVLSMGGTAVDLDVPAMMTSLTLVIVVPLVLAMGARRLLPTAVDRITPYGGGLVTLMLMVICAVPVAKQATLLLAQGWDLLWPLSLSFLVMSLQLAVGWLAAAGRGREERLAMTLSLGFKNIGLTMALALSYFPSDGVIFCCLSVVPWVVLIGLFKWLCAGRVLAAADPLRASRPLVAR